MKLLKILLRNLIFAQPVNQQNVGEKKILIEEEQKWLVEFMDRSDIYTNPGSKEFIPKHYVLCTIREILQIADGPDMVKTCETFQVKFQKKLTFC